MKACAIKGVKQFEIKEIKEPVADGKKVIIDVLKSANNITKYLHNNLQNSHEDTGYSTDQKGEECYPKSNSRYA